MTTVDDYIIKLGGSVITHKEKPYTLDRETLCSIASIIAMKPPIAIVHGGGSYGHHIVSLLLEEKEKLETKDLAPITQIMDTLNREVIQCLKKNRLNVVSIPPHAICYRSKRVNNCWMETVVKLVEGGLIPVLYGDAIYSDEEGVHIISGDELMVKLSNVLGVRRLYFLTNVDGVYKDPSREETLIKHLEIRRDETLDISWSKPRGHDVTGGMLAKLGWIKSLEPGTKAYILNGRKIESVKNALLNGKNPGTLLEVLV